MTEHPRRRPIWEPGERCQLCESAEVMYPAIFLCETCYDTLAGRKIREWYLRDLNARGSVRTVSGGLPSLGKRR
jgi:hypothetical protein